MAETLPPDLGCQRPPHGWYCSREPGHDGPCAARPVVHPGARQWGPNGEWVNPPAEGDDQARCWMLLFSGGETGTQCVLFNGHESDHQWEVVDNRHVVEFSTAGYGLQHPLRCRDDLIGCHVNRYLAGLDGPEKPPGRYVLTLTPDEQEHGRWRAWYQVDSDVAPSGVGGSDG